MPCRIGEGRGRDGGGHFGRAVSPHIVLAYIPLFCCWQQFRNLMWRFLPFAKAVIVVVILLFHKRAKERERILFYNYTQRLSSFSSSSFVPLPRFSSPPSPKNERLPLSPFASSSSSFFSLGCFLGGAGERGKGRRRARFSPLLLPRGKLEGRRRRRRRLWLGHKFQRLIFSKVEGGGEGGCSYPLTPLQ